MPSKNKPLRPKKALERSKDTGHQLAMNLRGAYLSMHRATNACLAESGLSADSFTLLTALLDCGSTTQKELTSRIHSDANTVSAMLARLEREKLIERKRDARDGRARLVELTAKGRSVQERLWAKSQSLRNELMTFFSAEECQNLIDGLKQIVGGLEKLNL